MVKRFSRKKMIAEFLDKGMSWEKIIKKFKSLGFEDHKIPWLVEDLKDMIKDGKSRKELISKYGEAKKSSSKPAAKKSSKKSEKKTSKKVEKKETIKKETKKKSTTKPKKEEVKADDDDEIDDDF